MGISATIPGRNKHDKQLPIDTSMLVMVEDLTMTEGRFRDQCVVAHTLAAFAILSTTLLQGSEGCRPRLPSILIKLRQIQRSPP
jgi:hypothetical protein